jgi:hypothetical protein
MTRIRFRIHHREGVFDLEVMGSASRPQSRQQSPLTALKKAPCQTTLADFLLLGDVESSTRFFMSIPSTILALLASLLIIGCATKQEEQFTPAQTALEKKDQREWASEEGRIR